MKDVLKRIPMELQFFAEDVTGKGESSDGTENTGNANKQDTSAGQHLNNNTEHMIPKTRFDEVNQRYKEVQSQLDELLKAKEEQEKAEAEKRGEFERLYQETMQESQKLKDKTEALSKRAEQLEGVINQLLEAKLETIPEDFRDLIPSDYTVEQKLEWISNAEKKGLFAKKQQQQVGGDTNGSGNTQADLTKLSPMQLFRMGYGKK